MLLSENVKAFFFQVLSKNFGEMIVTSFKIISFQLLRQTFLFSLYEDQNRKVKGPKNSVTGVK